MLINLFLQDEKYVYTCSCDNVLRKAEACTVRQPGCFNCGKMFTNTQIYDGMQICIYIYIYIYPAKKGVLKQVKQGF